MAEETYRAAIAAALALEREGPPTVVIDAADDQPVTSLIAKALAAGSAWVVEIPRVGSIFTNLAKLHNVSVFHVDDVPDSLFVTSERLAPGKSRILVSKGSIGAVVRGVPSGPEPKRSVKLLKTTEERYVLGVVLVPETKDSQGDIYSHDEVRNAAHVYMEKAQALGKQHSEIVTGKLKILESYVAPVSFDLESETIAKGTWLLGIRVVDDTLWAEVKKGSFTGFSIGGEAYRTPEEAPAAAG